MSRAAAALITLLAAAPSALARKNPDPVLVGAIDTHVHTEEEYSMMGDGAMDVIELAKRARDKGMRGVVVKSLSFETATRAYLARKAVPGVEVFGGLSLSRSVGGMNPAAVEAFAKLDLPSAKMVWLAVLDSRAASERNGKGESFVPVARGGKLTPESIVTLDAIAKHKLSLATSHLGADEALLVVRAAAERKIPVVVTHAAQDPVGMSAEQMKEVAKLGGFIEHTALGPIKGPDTHLRNAFYKNQRRVSLEDTVKFIREVGAEQTILASDYGQALNGPAPDGLKAFILGLKELGIKGDEIGTMTRKNPARLLGLDEDEKKRADPRSR